MTTAIEIRTLYDGDFIKKIVTSDSGKIPPVYWKIPRKLEADITEMNDPFVHLLIFPMMRMGGRFIFTGITDESLISNMKLFSKMWNIWRPNIYKNIEITSSELSYARRSNNGMITAFSGGLDGAYTTFKYKNCKKYSLEKSVMVLGADIPINNRSQFDIAFNNAKKMTDDLGIELVPLETNYRDFSANWEDEFGSVISSALGLFSSSYSNGAMAGGWSFHDYVLPWGTNPITDHFFTSDNFHLVVDGYEYTRTDKAAFIKDWKVGVENLRVCWRNSDKSKNCGCCEKCVRTKLNFLAVGVKDLPSMPSNFTPSDLSRDDIIQSRHNILFYREILNYAKIHNTLSKDTFELLRKFIEKWDRKFSRETSIFKRFKNKYLSGR